MTFARLAILCLFPAAPLAAQSDEKILLAIGQVESGGNRLALGDYKFGRPRAFGAFQMHVEAWRDANAQLKIEGLPAISISRWREESAQKAVGLAYLRALRRRLADVGRLDPSPETLALAWHLGFSGALKSNFAGSDYSERVGNLAR